MCHAPFGQISKEEGKKWVPARVGGPPRRCHVKKDYDPSELVLAHSRRLPQPQASWWGREGQGRIIGRSDEGRMVNSGDEGGGGTG